MIHKRRVMKKAQFKMMETMMVLVVFFILLGIGLIFYGAVQRASIQQYAQERGESEAVKIIQDILFLPEIACTDKNIIVDSCVDLYKARAMADIIENNDAAGLFYRKDFGDTRIKLWEIFPDIFEEEDAIVIYEPNVNLDEVEIIDKEIAEIPVSIKDSSKLSNEYSLGILKVEIERYAPKTQTS